MSKLLITMIISMCNGDTKDYYVAGYAQDCHHYYINCTVSNDVDIRSKPKEEIERVINKCKKGYR